jgi:16S rRNA (guanine966-N2)-methyltransferase
MGLVRIVGGTLRGRRIRVPDRGVRPTSERTREAVFDILGADRVRGARALDLYAGTGALGIEALSRGAASADFVEGDRATAAQLLKNLAALGLADRSSVRVAGLDRTTLPRGLSGPWDLVFLDPPYESGTGARWLAALGRAAWPRAGGIIVYERRAGAAEPPPETLRLATERTYGGTVVAIYHAGHAGHAGSA